MSLFPTFDIVNYFQVEDKKERKVNSVPPSTHYQNQTLRVQKFYLPQQHAQSAHPKYRELRKKAGEDQHSGKQAFLDERQPSI